MTRWSRLLRERSVRPALWLFAACAIAAVVVGFKLVTPAQAEKLIVRGGYYYILGVFALWLYFSSRVLATRRALWTAWLRRPGLVGLALAAAAGFALWSDMFAHKVLFDEYVLQGTAWHMHLTKEVGTPLRAYDFAGTWLVIDTFLDKRPYFFSFLIALLHDLTGYRLENVFVLNAALTLATLAAVYWLVRTLTGRVGPALLAVGLLATLPLFGQNATGASMELLNVAMIVGVMVAATLYLRAPDADRLACLVLATILLAQTRYESVLFVAPSAAVIVLGWWRAGRIILPWPAVIAPLLLVPYAWHDRFVGSKPILWQLREGEASRFAWHYAPGNLEGAWNFFSSTSPGQPNSLWLVLLGAAGLAWALVRLARWWRTAAGREVLPAVIPVTALFGLTIAANLGLLMFYYWSRLDEPIATRFALPFCLVLALTAGWFVHWLDRHRLPATRVAAAGLAVWLLVFAAPAYAHRFYTTQNMVMHETNWEVEQARARKRGVLWITAKATMPFLLERIPAVNTTIASVRAPQIAWHLREGTFRDVFVAQVMRPTTAQGDMIVDPDEVLPPAFQLETVAEKRFGGRWIRISRLTGIDLPPAGNQPGQ
ncbi:MAG: glycosyltransferase family 39 protein [Opitutaceae bacterium]|nr:glycosyltransferase family 39 protein [Opitutaceae bacterium]